MLAETWNGTAWAVQLTPNPVGANTSFLTGVSCSSATACTAVGYYTTSSGGQFMVAERWSGSAWAVQPIPNPAGATLPVLNGVSCSSTTACTAVGSYQGSSGQVMLAESWNGTAWAIQTTPNPAGATSSSMTAVSCSAATACTAVGSYVSSGNDFLLVERWDGTAWAVQSAANPAGASFPALNAVSCSSVTACTAVGSYFSSATGTTPLAEGWNGTGWAVQAAPNPAGSAFTSLGGVSCRGATVCTAVGFYNTSSGSLTLAEAWNGTAWVIQTTPNPAGATTFSALDGVSCTSVAACTAVGSSVGSANGVTLAETWNGTAWHRQTTPSPAGATNGTLGGVSCSLAAACTAVGSYLPGNNTGNAVTLAEAWNGTAWHIQAIPTDAFGSSGLNAVSCSSPTACTAVGSTGFSIGSEFMLAEAWNGTAWHIQTTPEPTGDTSSVLYGVSCSSATACTTVGTFQNSTGFLVTLAERWNGTAWHIEHIPNPAGATFSQLKAVSCSSATACTATGYYQDSSGNQFTLAEAWNGTAWHIQHTPKPAATTSAVLEGVSCNSPAACTAVGNYQDSSGNQFTLAEAWNGTTWRIQTTPNSAGTSFPALNGVSCRTVADCTAVGSYVDSSGNQFTLAEAWNGTAWRIQTTPNPAGATLPALNGVSCRTATACTAVGLYQNASGNTVTLAEANHG